MSTRSKPARRECAGDCARPPRLELLVYVLNRSPRSAVTVVNLERLCKQYVPGRYRIHTVDLLRSPDRCRQDQIVAVPTVERHWPLPRRRVIGTLADSERAVAGLDLDAVN
jgi:circadian clock protein KaiB